MLQANPRRIILEGLFRGETDTKVWEFKYAEHHQIGGTYAHFVFDDSYGWLSLDAIGVLTNIHPPEEPFLRSSSCLAYLR